jgi:hypothetical protein
MYVLSTTAIWQTHDKTNKRIRKGHQLKAVYISIRVSKDICRFTNCICSRNTSTGVKQNNGNANKLRNRICLCWLYWKNFSWQHWMFFFRLFTFCSARVSALVIVWKNRKMWDLSDFERGHRWCAFSWSICDKNYHVIRCIESYSF